MQEREREREREREKEREHEWERGEREREREREREWERERQTYRLWTRYIVIQSSWNNLIFLSTTVKVAIKSYMVVWKHKYYKHVYYRKSPYILLYQILFHHFSTWMKSLKLLSVADFCALKKVAKWMSFIKSRTPIRLIKLEVWEEREK